MTSTLARAALLSAAFFVAAQLSSALSLPNSFATFWPPSGILLAVLLRTDPRAWPWLAIATCPANLAFDALYGRQQSGVDLEWGEPVPDLVLVTDRRKLMIVMRNLIAQIHRARMGPGRCGGRALRGRPARARQRYRHSSR
jgi:hypothetical protein